MKTEQLLAGIREAKTLDELKAHMDHGISIDEYDFTDEEFAEIQAATRAKRQLLEYQLSEDE